jgi:hypothetical protein
MKPRMLFSDNDKSSLYNFLKYIMTVIPVDDHEASSCPLLSQFLLAVVKAHQLILKIKGKAEHVRPQIRCCCMIFSVLVQEQIKLQETVEDFPTFVENLLSGSSSSSSKPSELECLHTAHGLLDFNIRIGKNGFFIVESKSQKELKTPHTIYQHAAQLHALMTKHGKRVGHGLMTDGKRFIFVVAGFRSQGRSQVMDFETSADFTIADEDSFGRTIDALFSRAPQGRTKLAKGGTEVGRRKGG